MVISIASFGLAFDLQARTVGTGIGSAGPVILDAPDANAHVADVFGLRFKGVVAWFMHRSYHVMFMPTVNRKFRVFVDWTQALFSGREVVALGQIHEPKAEFDRATKS